MKNYKEIFRINGNIKHGDISSIPFSLSMIWFIFKESIKAKLKGKKLHFLSIHWNSGDTYSIIIKKEL